MRVIIILFLSFYANAQVGLNTSIPQGVFHIDSKTNNNKNIKPEENQQADDIVVLFDGTTGIGTTTPNHSSILDLNVDNLPDGDKKGFLPPRLNLKSLDDIQTIQNPAEGLLVYNLDEYNTLNFKGYLFWNGNKWQKINLKTEITPEVSQLKCNEITIKPKTFTRGVIYNGEIHVPYKKGNQAYYKALSIGPINGLTATLPSGRLNAGNGILKFKVSGIPDFNNDNIFEFNVDFLENNCPLTLREQIPNSIKEFTYYKSSPVNASLTKTWLSDNTSVDNNLPILDGKIQLDAYFKSNSLVMGNYSVIPAIVNISSSPVKIWYSTISGWGNFGYANYILPSKPTSGKSFVYLDNEIYSNTGVDHHTNMNNLASTSGNNSQGEFFHVDILLENKLYRVRYFFVVDNLNNTNNSDDIRNLYLSVQQLY